MTFTCKEKKYWWFAKRFNVFITCKCVSTVNCVALESCNKKNLFDR